MRFKIICIVTSIAMFNGCQLVDLEKPIVKNEGIETISGASTVPTEETVFHTILHNNSSKVWSASGFTIMGIDGFQDCRLDDKITIFSNGTYEYDGGELLCLGGDNDRIKSGTWSKKNGEHKLIFDTGVAVVEGLDSNSLVVIGEYQGLEIRGSYTAN